MASEFDLAFPTMPESNIRHGSHPDPVPAPLDNPYHIDFSQSIIPDFNIPALPQPDLTTPVEPSPITTQGRLAGEPAYCSGRHCCQWTTGGFTCNNHYPSAADLDRHVAMDHAGRLPDRQPSGDYHCYWAGCNKSESFGNKPKLTRHIHSHTGHKPHPCLFPGCGKGFVTKEQLKNHETTHTKTKEHICPECGKGFAVKTALTSHMNVHKGTKPYICEECGKGFADSSNLSKHKAIHKRVAIRRHRHHVHRSSISTTASSSVFPSSPYPCSAHHDLGHFHLPTDGTTLISDSTACQQPCYDSQCPSPYQVACHASMQCKTSHCAEQDCDMAAFDNCELPCEMAHCEPCQLQDCDTCDVPHCELNDCIENCLDLSCPEPHEMVACYGHEHSFKAPIDPQIMYTGGGLTPLSVTPGPTEGSVMSGIDEDHFKQQLCDFIASDYGQAPSHHGHVR